MAGSKNDVGQLLIDAGGPHPSLDELYRLHGEWLRALVRRRLRVQSADADDIVQDTYLRATRVPAADISSARSYLSRIALNLFRDRSRREAVRRDHRAAVSMAKDGATPLAGLQEQEASLELERLIHEIPETYRAVFAMSRFRHMSNKDIAEHLDISIKTVEWRIGKALEFCMSRLRD